MYMIADTKLAVAAQVHISLPLRWKSPIANQADIDKYSGQDTGGRVSLVPRAFFAWCVFCHVAISPLKAVEYLDTLKSLDRKLNAPFMMYAFTSSPELWKY